MLSISTIDDVSELLQTGTTWTDTTTDPSTGDSTVFKETVAGPTTYDGMSVVELDGSTNAGGTLAPYAVGYYGLDADGDFVDYEVNATVGGGATDDETYTPYNVLLPGTLSAGQTVTCTDTDQGVVDNAQGVSTSTSTDTDQFTLSSETPTPITVGNTTYSAYEVTEVYSFNNSDGSTSSPDTTQNWYAPGYGDVKSIDTKTGDVTELTSFGEQDHLAFVPATQIPTTAVAATIQPPIVVQVQNSSNQVDTNASGSVMLTLQSASRLNVSTGTLGGTVSQPIVDGQATFSDLSVSAAGTYTLTASDTNNDAPITSAKFKIGTNTLQLSITSKAPRGAKGVEAGDNIFYSFVITPMKAVQTQNLVITFPANFVPSKITQGGQPSGNTIVWNSAALRGATFDLKVPDVHLLTTLKAVVVTGDDNVVYVDSTTDEATASNTVKLASTYEVDGVVRDAIFRPGKVGNVVLSTPLSRVTLQLIDDTGALIDTVVTSGNGKFQLLAQNPGTYTILLSAQADTYSSDSNQITGTRFYGTQSVTFQQNQESPTDIGDLVMPRTFLNTSATLLGSLNNYNVSAAQGLASLNVDLFQFNTSAAEGVITGLIGSPESATPLLNADALHAGSSTDPWVAAIRMMAGLYEVNQRFTDALKLCDTTGKVFGVILSGFVAAATDKSVFGINKNSPNGLGTVLWEPNTPQLQLTGASAASYNVLRTLTFTGLGDTCSQAADEVIAKINAISPYKLNATDKSGVIAAMFTALRFGADILTNSKFISDAAFELAFTAFRLSFDAFLLHLATGVSLRNDIPTAVSLLVAPAYSLSGLGTAFDDFTGGTVQFPTMQQAIDSSVSNRANYDTGTDTNDMLSTLDQFDSDAHGRAGYESLGLKVFNTTSSNAKAVDGALFQLQNKVGAASAEATLLNAPLQTTLRSIQSESTVAFGKVAGKTAIYAQILSLLTGIAGVFEQDLTTTYVPTLVQTGSTGSNILSVLQGTGGAAEVTKPAVTPAPKAQPLASAAVSATAPADSAAFVADLNQLSKLVKAKNATGIVPVYQQLLTDQQALFTNDLNVLDSQATSLASQFSTAQISADGKFHTALSEAAQSVFTMFEQLDAWGTDIAAGNAGDVTSQISTAIAAVNSVESLAPAVRSAVAGFSIPVTLQIDQSAVPINVPVNSTQTLTFTVTNLGSQAAAAGSVYFNNSDGSLVLQSPTQQSLPALAPGASTTVSWQVDVLPQQNGSTSAVYQVQAVSGQTIGAVTDQITVTG